MKKLIHLILLICFVQLLFAQTTLPTNHSFDTPLPMGWSESGTNFYTSSVANTPPSVKLDGDGDYVQIHFTDAAGPVEYYLAGTGSQQGIFNVEESADNVSWTPLDTYTNNLPSSNALKTTPLPQPASRYIRFILVDKISGSNVSLDDITIPLGPAGPVQEINVVESMTSIPNNGNVTASTPTGVPTTISLTIENLGTASPLAITSAMLTNNTAFTIPTAPVASIPASTNITLDVIFTPTGSGTFTDELVIVNDDPDESNYIINLVGYGDGLASEPASQPLGFNATLIKTYRFDNLLIAATPAPEGHLVLQTDAAFSDAPVDGVEYGVGDIVGNSKVVHIGTATSFFTRGIIANTDFHYAIFAYNGSGTFTNYLQTGPLTKTVTTPDGDPGTYYSGISTTAATFVTDLSALINPHFQQFYGNYHRSMINKFYGVDTINGQNTISCNYSSDVLLYNNPFSWTSTSYSREHTLPHSWMPTFPDQNTPQYSDYHNLYPVEGNVNTTRQTFPFDEVVTSTYTYLDATQGFDNTGAQIVFEPRDENKGDAARALMYMMVAYNGIDGNSWALKDLGSNGPIQDPLVLMQWHCEDPPSNIEIARNDFVDSLQSNRNPFVDHPEYAHEIDWYTLTKKQWTTNCTNVANEEVVNLKNSIVVYPTPTSDVINIEINNEFKGQITLEITDITGKVIQTQVTEKQSDQLTHKIDVAALSSGFYLMKVTQNGHSAAAKFVVE